MFFGCSLKRPLTNLEPAVASWYLGTLLCCDYSKQTGYDCEKSELIVIRNQTSMQHDVSDNNIFFAIERNLS